MYKIKIKVYIRCRQTDFQNKTPLHKKIYSIIKLHKGNNTTYNQEALCGGLFCMKVDFFPSHKIRLHDIVNISLHNIDNSLHFIGKKATGIVSATLCRPYLKKLKY